MVKYRKVEQDVPATEEGPGDGRKSVEAQLEGVRGLGSLQVQVADGGVTGADGSQTGLQHLHSDLLVQVFTYLPHTELFEFMSVCKAWEKAVMEASVLRKELHICKRWDLEGIGGRSGDRAGNQMVQTVLKFAKQLTFSVDLRYMRTHIMAVAGVERPNLRVLILPFDSANTATISLLLSNCPDLEILIVGGDILGALGIHISHLALRTFEFRGFKSRPLTVHCPNLTRLSTSHLYTAVNGVSGEARAISLFCPSLTDLCLLKQHSAPALLEYMASHAPNIERLKFDCHGEDRSNLVTQFKSLRRLHLYDFQAISPHALDELPLLDDLVLDAHKREGAVRLVVRHKNLRKLCIRNFDNRSSFVISCPLLEELSLRWTCMVKLTLEHLNSTCPKIKSLQLDMSDFRGDSFIVYHETLEEMKMCNLSCDGVRLTCPHLTSLELTYGEVDSMTLPNLEADCMCLKKLYVYGYNDIYVLPSILKCIPLLESLRIVDSSSEGEELDLVHPHVQVVELKFITMRQKLILSMPSLEQLNIYESDISELTIASNKSVTLEPNRRGVCIHGGSKKVFRGGESVTIGIRSEKTLLGVVHGEDTL